MIASKRSVIQSVQKYWTMLLMIAIFVACDENDSPVNEEDEQHVGAVRGNGAAIGTAENFQVGADGGQIRSADGVLEVEIPPGALSGTTTISIQLIENTAPNGVGNSYRLTPHKIEFLKPVTISFIYKENSVSFPAGLGVAFQDDAGVWQWPGNLNHDHDRRKVSVHTNHFSDWSLFESMHIMPDESFLQPGGEVELAAYRVVPVKTDEDLLTPLVNVDPVSLGDPQPLDEKYIKEWKLIGEGTLDPEGHTAMYTAPQKIPPDNNPVTVTLEVELRNGSKSFLLAYITIAGCSITLNGGLYANSKFQSTETAMGGYLAEADMSWIGFYGYDSNGNDVMVYLTFPGKSTGQYTWTPDQCYVMTQQAINDQVIDGGSMLEDNPPIVHPGSVTISSINKEQAVLTGSFSGNFTIGVSGGSCLPDPCISYGTVEGNFIAEYHH